LFYQTCGHYECLKTTPEAALSGRWTQEIRRAISGGVTAHSRKRKHDEASLGGCTASDFNFKSPGTLGGQTAASGSKLPKDSIRKRLVKEKSGGSLPSKLPTGSKEHKFSRASQSRTGTEKDEQLRVEDFPVVKVSRKTLN